MSAGRSSRPKGRLRVGLGEPVAALPGGGLHAVLALGGRPPDVEAVDADAVGLERVARVAGERHQRALGGRIGGQHGLAAVAGHRDDVHHAAARRTGASRRAACCVSTNGARALTANSRSHSSTLVSSTPPRVLRPAALTSPSTRPKCASTAGDHREHRIRIRRARRGTKASVRARPRRPLPRARLRPQTATLASQGGGAARDRGAQPLGAAGDDEHLAVEPQLAERVAHALSTSSMRTGRHSRSERQAARPMTSGARASGAGHGRRRARRDRGDERLPLAQVARDVALEVEVRQRRRRASRPRCGRPRCARAGSRRPPCPPSRTPRRAGRSRRRPGASCRSSSGSRSRARATTTAVSTSPAAAKAGSTRTPPRA